jgi:hypothetical protein
VKRAHWIALAVVAGLVLLGGGSVAYVAIERRRMAELLREAFRKAGLPPAWGEALGMVESNLNSIATNKTGADLKRGGAYGPTQITEKTARAYGFKGSMDELLQNPALAAEWTARIAAAGKPKTIDDLGAWWNAGRVSFALLDPSHVTRTIYVPRLRAALAKVQA